MTIPSERFEDVRTEATPPLRSCWSGTAWGALLPRPLHRGRAELAVVGVVTTSPLRRAQPAEDLPGVPAYDDLADALPHADVVVITTPPETRRALVLQAIAAGVPVVADKPFGPDAATARELRDAALAARVPLAVFHNRRWDADIRTLKELVDRRAVGDVWRFTSRCAAGRGTPAGVRGRRRRDARGPRCGPDQRCRAADRVRRAGTAVG
jgi:predicted dehydrogenase